MIFPHIYGLLFVFVFEAEGTPLIGFDWGGELPNSWRENLPATVCDLFLILLWNFVTVSVSSFREVTWAKMWATYYKP